MKRGSTAETRRSAAASMGWAQTPPAPPPPRPVQGPGSSSVTVRVAPPEPALTPEQAAALHAGMLQVRALERSGNRRAAIEKAEELVKQFPGNRRVENVLIDYYRAEGRPDDLARLLKARAQRDPDDAEACRDLATLLLSDGQTDAAVEVLRKHIAGNPQDETRYRLAGALLASREANDAAIRFYRQGRATIGVETLFAPELAQLELEQGNSADAITEYLLMATDPGRRPRVYREVALLLDQAENRDEILARVEEMRRRHPDSVPIQDVAAMAFMKLGRYQEALAAVKEADRRAGDQGEHLLDFGRQALEGASPDSVSAERAHAGVEALLALAERHPKSTLNFEATRLAAQGLVAIARAQPDPAARQALLQEALALIDRNWQRLPVPRFQSQVLALKGMILLEDLDRPAEALDVFEKVAEQQRRIGDPDEIVQVQIARCRMAIGDLKTARTSLERMAKSDSTPPPPLGKRRPNEPKQVGLTRARYYLAELDLIDGKYEEARGGFTALAEQAPEDRLANDCLDLAMTLDEAAGEPPVALQGFGAYRRALLVHDEAAEKRELETLVRESPESALAPVALFALGGLIEEERQHAAALQHYQDLLARYPQHRLAPRALEASGDLQLRAFRRPDLAVAAYERLLLEYPDDLFLDGVRKKLVLSRAAVRGGTHATP